MKIVLKNGFIVASHSDEQDISLDQYPGASEVAIVPDDTLVMDDNGIFLPDPRQSIDLEILRSGRLSEAKQSITDYIYSHYDSGQQSSLLMTRQTAISLNNTAVVALVDQVFAWAASALSVYYGIKSQLETAQTTDALLAITWTWPPDVNPVQLSDIISMLGGK
ncbi:MAG: hypothetical protein HQK60_01840 [Deltaproteobacteria bacterium]|nr:hypothetical protein [Deltaproteobacteria bacterium]